MKYHQENELEDGWTAWITPSMDEYHLACCDCGLVHVFQFKVARGRVYYRARRDKRATGQKRRHMQEPKCD